MSVVVWIGVVLIGGAGSVLRFVVDRAAAGYFARSFPFGTLLVNLTGALILGFLTGMALSHNLALLVGTALVGSYTTYSTWMLETQRLSEERQHWISLANLVVSVVLGLCAVAVGQAIGEHL